MTTPRCLSAALCSWSLCVASVAHAQTPTAAPPAAPATPATPDAGWHSGQFYLSNPAHDWFLIPTGRLQTDFNLFVGDRIGADDTAADGSFRRGDVKSGFQLRRARIELTGGFMGRYTFMLSGELDASAAPIATDVFVHARVTPMLNFQLGQFNAPFTLENYTSDKYLDFMERSLAVRGFGIPTNKEIGLMTFGETPDRLLAWQGGVFNGDGTNRLNRDNHVDFIGRVFAHPLIRLGGPLSQLQLGASFRYGHRGLSVDYAYPSVTSLAGFALFNPQIVGGAMPVTVVPDSDQLAGGVELDLPIGRVDLRGEVVLVRNGTREMVGATLTGNGRAAGQISGVGYYAQVGLWLWGDIGINGRPGYQNPPSLRLATPDPSRPPMGMQVLARIDGIRFDYDGASRATTAMRSAAADGRYEVLSLDAAVNFWATRHVRFSVDYLHYLLPGQPADPSAPAYDENHMRGPRNNTSAFGELSLRVGLAI